MKKIADRDRVKFLLSLMHIVSVGSDYRSGRKRSYTDWSTHSFRHWRRWKIGDDSQQLRALDTVIRKQ